MKSSILFFTLMFCWAGAIAQQKPANISIIPEPQQLKAMPGSFVLNRNVLVHYEGKAGKTTADLLNAFLKSAYGFELNTSSQPLPGQAQQRAIRLVEAAGNPEAYTLDVAAGAITLKGDAPGLFYGLQTLQQLLPLKGEAAIHVPAVHISDAPRFAYRGLMLDVGRHFFDTSYIKHFIDVMAQYKFNRFHWHLTEDQGWRIEIKKYPRLQEIASRRKETVVGRHTSNVYDGKPYGGYYTQDEVRDIVRYAAARHITVIPEIEMPGHSRAALAAYPNLGCTGGPYEVATTFGVIKDVYCAGNDSVYAFLEDVLNEVLELFPSQYIHIGGDECPKDRWKQCPKCQRRIKELGLKDEHALQSYFIQRMEKFLNGKGRRIIGWDEILEGGLAPNATVMSWRGESGGIAAAREKHDVIMTPNTYLYLDYYQGDPATEPLNIGGYLPLPTVYNYEPLPPSLSAQEQQYIKGVQANIWTEYIAEPWKADYMTWPRALAAAEICWSPAAKKNLNRFMQKLPAQLARMEQAGVNFRIPEPVGLQNALATGNSYTVTLQPPVTGAAIYYTTDGSEPNAGSARYTKPVQLQLATGKPTTFKCIVVLPSGRKSAVYSATYLYRNYMPAAGVTPSGKGLRFKAVYNAVPGQARQLPATADSTGSLPQFSISPFLHHEKFGVTYEGYVKVEADGIYELKLTSDDGSVLYLDDEQLLDNDGEHAPAEKTGWAPLRKGYHKIKLQYFNAGGGAELKVSLSRNGQALNLRNALFH